MNPFYFLLLVPGWALLRTWCSKDLHIGAVMWGWMHHVCKLPEGGVPRAPAMRSFYGRWLDRDYREKVLGAGLSRNAIYVSIAFEPDYPLGKAVGRRATPKRRRPRKEERQAFKETLETILDGLKPYGVRLLGLRGDGARDF